MDVMFSRIKEGAPFNGVVRKSSTACYRLVYVYDSNIEALLLGTDQTETTTMQMMYCADTLQDISNEINRLNLPYDQENWGFELPPPQPVSHLPIPTESDLKMNILIYMDRWGIPYDADESQTKAELIEEIENFWGI